MGICSSLRGATRPRDPGGQAGFPPELPTTGLLSFFCDPTPRATGGLRVIWTNGPATGHAPPGDLLAYYAASDDGQARPWQERTQAEALLPFSVITIPDHWSQVQAVATWFSEIEDFRPVETTVGQSANFGDRLGGWPVAIQRDPEEVMDDVSDQPGVLPWRHLFSWGGECWGDTKVIPITELYDGIAYVMMPADDLAQHRFDQARLAIQFT